MPGSYRHDSVTPGLSWSHTVAAVTPPKYAKARVWLPIQSGPRCVRVASAYVKFEAPSTATNSSTSIRSPVFSSQMHGFLPE